MSLIHSLRRVVCVLLVYAMGIVTAHANFDWQNFETLFENGQYVTAIEKLDTHLGISREKQDDKEWTLSLLRGAKLRAAVHQQGSAINYLLYNQWPEAKLPHAILNLALAREYEAYYLQSAKSFQNQSIKELTDKAKDKHNGINLIDKISYHYQLAYEIAYRNNFSTQQAETYLTQGDYPVTVRRYLSDVVAAYWLHFLADDTFWTSQQKQSLSLIKLSGLLNFSKLENLTLKHPLLRVKKLSQQLISKHLQFGNQEEVFEVKRFYTKLLTRYFDDKKGIVQLSHYLSDQLRELGTQYPWWTMGQFQLALLQQKLLKNRQPLTPIHDLAVQASIIHPESLGSIRSRQLINELEVSEYTIIGTQTADLNQPSIGIQFRNLQKLYFKAWKTTQPAPTLPNDLSKLLSQKPDKAWSATLLDRFDLRKQSIQHTPAIDAYGQWLVAASPNEDFQEATSDIQFLSMQFTRYVASVSYFNNEFNVSVYRYGNGLPRYNVPVDLLKVEDGTEKVLSTVKTDRKGNAILRRQSDADYFRIRVGQGNDTSTIDVPALLPIKDEASWSQRRAKSVLVTDKDTYTVGDTLFWSTISRAEASESIPDLRANTGQKGQLRLFDQNNKLLLTKRYVTDASGTASGSIKLSRKSYPKLSSGQVFRLEASWGGQKVIRMLTQLGRKAPVSKLPSIKLLPPSDYYNQGEFFSVQGTARGCHQQASEKNTIHWSLKRSSTKLNGALHSYLEIDRGSTSPDKSGRFSFETQLILGEDKTYQLKHNFTLYVKCHDKYFKKVLVKQPLFHHDRKSYYSVLNAQSFFVEGEANTINLQRNNIHSIGQTGESDWYIYERLPSKLNDWMRGVLKQVGTVSHATNGRAKLALNLLDSGLYRLRVVPKNKAKQAAFEFDFIIAKAWVSNNLKLPSVLLTETTEFDVNNTTLRLLAGNGNKQWSRLTISRDNKQLANQMLSPGIHLLSFPINTKHQGGVHFLLEWVSNEGIAHREINIEVPWTKKQLAVSVSENHRSEQALLRLKVLDDEGEVVANSNKSKALLFFLEVPEGFHGHNLVNLHPLYWQSRSSVMRLNSSGKRYSEYFSEPKHIPKVFSDEVKLPHIKFSAKGNDPLNTGRAEFVIPALRESYPPKNLDAVLNELSSGISDGVDNDISGSSYRGYHRLKSRFVEAFLDKDGGLDISLPEIFRGKQVQMKVIVVTPDLQTGQLSVIIR